MLPWSWKYERCAKCGTDSIPHKGRGLCRRCYYRQRKRGPQKRYKSGTRLASELNNILKALAIASGYEKAIKNVREGAVVIYHKNREIGRIELKYAPTGGTQKKETK